jgi:tRNA(Arg) A34 adenosine deaminase TadA
MAAPHMHRRNLIKGMAAALGAVAVSGPAIAQSTGPAPTATPLPPIEQPATPGRRAFMQRAFAMRQQAIDSGDQAFGAVIVQGNKIVGLGPSRVVVNGDPSAHAEMEAIRDACRRLGTRDLSDCVMYSTSRPCRMCETAAHWARVSRLFHGNAITDGGAPRYDNC